LICANFHQKPANAGDILDDFIMIVDQNHVKNSSMADVMAMKIDLKQKKNVTEYASFLISFINFFNYSIIYLIKN
jgi:hypothetical protein